MSRVPRTCVFAHCSALSSTTARKSSAFCTCLIGEVLLLDQLHLRPEEGRVVQRVVDVLVVQRVLAVRERNREPAAAAAGHLAFQAAGH